jgi:hypothetical protein
MASNRNSLPYYFFKVNFIINLYLLLELYSDLFRFTIEILYGLLVFVCVHFVPPTLIASSCALK